MATIRLVLGISSLDGAVTKSVNIHVISAPVTGVSLNTTSLSFISTATQTLTASVLPVTAANKTVTWRSSDTNIATVSAAGVVTPVANGTATITVTTADGGKTATCLVTVSGLLGLGSVTFGSNTYKTYTYSNGTTWMVENSKEGSTTNSSNYGRYYYWTNRGAACPAGWSVPSENQWNILATYLNASATSTEKNMWFSGSALAGQYEGSQLKYLNTDGVWWSNSAELQCYVAYNSGGYGLFGPAWANNNTHQYTVRCIKN